MSSDAEELRGDVVMSAFDARTAHAVVAVLRRTGLAVRAVEVSRDEVEVRVPRAERSLALSTLAERMEEVHAEAAAVEGRATPRRERPRRAEPASASADPDDPHSGPPLVMERFANLGVGIAIVLVPLLALTIATPSLPRPARVVLFVAAVVGLLVYLRRRRRS